MKRLGQSLALLLCCSLFLMLAAGARAEETFSSFEELSAGALESYSSSGDVTFEKNQVR